MKQLFFLLFSFITFYSCKHEPKEVPEPEISFANDVQPIINSNCAKSGCHGSENTSEFTLLSYDDVIKNGDIKADEPLDSDLLEKITEQDLDDRMPPPPNNPLTAEQIDIIKKWIAQGAKNN